MARRVEVDLRAQKLLRVARTFEDDDLRIFIYEKIVRYVEGFNETVKLLEIVVLPNEYSDEDRLQFGNLLRNANLELAQVIEMENDIVRYLISKKQINILQFAVGILRYSVGNVDRDGNTTVHTFVNSEIKKFMPLVANPYAKIHSEVYLIQSEKTSNIVLDWLSINNVDFNVRNEQGYTALELAVLNNVNHLIPSLIKYTSDVGQLHCRNSESLAHLFLKANAAGRKKCSANVMSMTRYNAFSCRNNYKCIEAFLFRGFRVLHEVGVNGSSLLYNAVKLKCSLPVVQILVHSVLQNDNLRDNILLEICKCSAWHGSTANFLMEVAHSLLTSGANVNIRDANGKSPLFWSLVGKNIALATLLCDHGADFNVLTVQNESLYHALASRRYCCVDIGKETLLQLVNLIYWNTEINVNTATFFNNETALHLAIQSENLLLVRELLSMGADVNRSNIYGKSPLHYSVYNESHEIVKFLLENDANVNARNENGYTPLHTAASWETSLHVVPLLLKWGGHVNLRSYNNGYTPFYRAVFGCCINNVQSMLEYGANVNDAKVISLITIDNNDYWSKIKYLLKFHWIKLVAAGLPASDEYKYIGTCETEKFHLKCLAELEKMKRVVVNENLSVYDFLVMTTQRRCNFVNNSKLRNTIMSRAFRKNFPRYVTVVLSCYREAVNRKKLAFACSSVLTDLCNFRLPNECAEIIFSYLTETDLIVLSELQ